MEHTPEGPQTPVNFFGNLFIFEPWGMLTRGLLNVGIFFDFQVARLFFSWFFPEPFRATLQFILVGDSAGQ